MQFSHIKETCLYIQDLDGAEAFYHGLLGLPLISRRENRHVFFRAGQSVLLCFNPEVTKDEVELPPHFAQGNQHMAFECLAGEYEAWKNRLAALNIPIIHEAQWPGGRRSCYFHDHEQNVLEIVEPGIWG
jgi:catechol 2,3-dioxygenase-like lactoylglutathione lyase family enzyme